MKLKKYLMAGLCAIGVTAFAVGAAACDFSFLSKVQFENWEKTGEATASLGSIYQIKDRSITDTDGNVHYYDFNVTDSKGNKTTVIGGEFEVVDFGGYTIEYSLTISSRDVRTREVRLKVVDDSAPKISVSLPTGFVNENYQIPEITVSDLSGESITPTYVLYQKSDETKAPIALQNGRFKPAQKGTYCLEINAKDSSGNSVTTVKEFGVRAAAEENILENFDDEASLLNSINGAENQEWLETFEGRDGVIRIKGTEGEKAGFLFRFMREREAYKHLPFDSITVSLYVDVVYTEKNSQSADLYQTTTDGSGATDWFGAAKNKWHEFTITDFEDWEYFFNGATSDRGGQLFWMWKNQADIKDVYIDEIRFAATPKIEFTTSAADNKVLENEEVSIAATVKADSRLVPYLTVKSPSGERVTLNDGKFTATERGWYVVKAIVETAEWSYYDTSAELKILCLGNYIKVGDNFSDEDMGKTYLLSDEHALGEVYALPKGVVYNPITNEVVSENVSVTVTRGGNVVTTQDGAFTPSEAGVYQITYTSGEYTTECELYVVQKTLATNELDNFGTKESAAKAKYGQDGQGVGIAPEWLPEYAGKAGVLKLNDKGMEFGYMLRIDKTYDEVKTLEWDYIDVTLYLKSGDWLNWGYAVDNQMNPVNPSKPWTTNEWTTLTIAKSNLADADEFLKALTSRTGAHLFWGWDIKDDVYIDGITFRGINSTLNDFATSATTGECLNGGNGVGTAAKWLETYEGANGVLKANDGGNMGGFYFRTNAVAAADLASYDWSYIEIRLWASNSSWVMFYEQDLATQIKGGEWTTLKISRSAIEKQMPISSFCALLTGDTGAQLFWAYDDLGDVYFDSIVFSK